MFSLRHMSAHLFPPAFVVGIAAILTACPPPADSDTLVLQMLADPNTIENLRRLGESGNYLPFDQQIETAKKAAEPFLSIVDKPQLQVMETGEYYDPITHTYWLPPEKHAVRPKRLGNGEGCFAQYADPADPLYLPTEVRHDEEALRYCRGNPRAESPLIPLGLSFAPSMRDIMTILQIDDNDPESSDPATQLVQRLLDGPYDDSSFSPYSQGRCRPKDNVNVPIYPHEYRVLWQNIGTLDPLGGPERVELFQEIWAFNTQSGVWQNQRQELMLHFLCYTKEGGYFITPPEEATRFQLITPTEDPDIAKISQTVQVSADQAALIQQHPILEAYLHPLVWDSWSYLLWQRTRSPTQLTQPEAEAYCNNLVLGQFDDWRLPSYKELYSLHDIDLFLPAHESVLISDVQFTEQLQQVTGINNAYWSRSKRMIREPVITAEELLENPNLINNDAPLQTIDTRVVYGVDFNMGQSFHVPVDNNNNTNNTNNTDTLAYARCVRGTQR